MEHSYSVIGAMAGSSMDGLDMAHVVFERDAYQNWIHQLHSFDTTPYPDAILHQLKQAPNQRIEIKRALDHEFGQWISHKINHFKKSEDKIDLLGIHGHTVVHDPKNRVSWQLGDGAIIAKLTGIPTVTEFRSLDVELGGQGAPLVPLGDFMLFREFDGCLNLGGIANISVKENQTAWDICPCNQVLNYFSGKLGKSYDDGGRLAQEGQLDKDFLNHLHSIDYFNHNPPKSLPNDFIHPEILDRANPKDGLHTYIDFMSDQVARSLAQSPIKKILVTGGGAFNQFLIRTLESRLPGIEVVVPSSEVINFKEAVVFAFLALKRSLNEINVLASVTGASKDSCSGVIHLPND